MARSRSRADAPWSSLSDEGQAALLERLRARLDAAYADAVVPAVDRAGRVGTLTLSGTGKRRLPGMRRDLRPYVLRAATDGRFLTARFEVDGALLDTITAAAPTAADVDAVVAFFARHAPRIWWKGPRPLPSDAPAPRTPRKEDPGGGTRGRRKATRPRR